MLDFAQRTSWQSSDPSKPPWSWLPDILKWHRSFVLCRWISVSLSVIARSALCVHPPTLQWQQAAMLVVNKMLGCQMRILKPVNTWRHSQISETSTCGTKCNWCLALWKHRRWFSSSESLRDNRVPMVGASFQVHLAPYTTHVLRNLTLVVWISTLKFIENFIRQWPKHTLNVYSYILRCWFEWWFEK